MTAFYDVLRCVIRGAELGTKQPNRPILPAAPLESRAVGHLEPRGVPDCEASRAAFLARQALASGGNSTSFTEPSFQILMSDVA